MKTKKQAPVFLKILLGVVGVYLITNFLIGRLFGDGLNSVTNAVSGAKTLGIIQPESYNNEMDSGMGGGIEVTEPMMVKSVPADRMIDRDNVVPMPMPTPNVQGAPVPNVDKKIVKNGSVELKVDNAAKVADKISEIAKEFGGDILSSNSRRQSNGSLRGNLVIKVPVDKFDEAMSAIKKAGEKVIFESVNADDVTMEYIDLKARLNNKKAEEKTFQKLLDRSGALKDVLSVTRELTRVRSEIDSLEGQLKYMTTQTDMSTINVILTEFVQIATDRDSWKPWRVVTSSLHNLILNSQNFIDGLIRFVIVQLPILIVVTLLLLGAYKIILKIYRKFRK